MNIAICDDNEIFLEKLCSGLSFILKSKNIPATIHSFTDGYEILKKFKSHSEYYDIIILDIDMPKMDGKELARKLRTYNAKFKLMFISSLEGEVYNTFQYGIDSFIPKNRVIESLETEITRIINKIDHDKANIQIFETINDDNVKSLIKLDLDDIIYFECVLRKIYIHTLTGTYKISERYFEKIIQKYTELNFIEIHRACIVNLKYIFSVNDLDITLDDGTKLPMSRRQKKPIINAVGNLVRNEVFGKC